MNAWKKKTESFGFEENPVPADRYDDNKTKWIVVSCDENGAIRSDVTVPDDDEIYAQIAFQEHFFNGVLVR